MSGRAFVAHVAPVRRLQWGLRACVCAGTLPLVPPATCVPSRAQLMLADNMSTECMQQVHVWRGGSVDACSWRAYVMCMLGGDGAWHHLLHLQRASCSPCGRLMAGTAVRGRFSGVKPAGCIPPMDGGRDAC